MKTRSYETGGGVVLDDRGRVLLIERRVEREEGPRHEIRLPKGGIDPAETPWEAALREVCEETGYCRLEMAAPLGDQTVEYDFRDEHVVRREHYFLMRLADEERREPRFSDPESEEARFTVRWAADFDEAEALLTYEAEKQVLRRAREASAALGEGRDETGE